MLRKLAKFIIAGIGNIMIIMTMIVCGIAFTLGVNEIYVRLYPTQTETSVN